MAGQQRTQSPYQGNRQPDGLVDVFAHGLVRLVGLRVLAQRLGQVLGKRGIRHQQTVFFAPERAVNPGKCLHQQRALERSVQIQSV